MDFSVELDNFLNRKLFTKTPICEVEINCVTMRNSGPANLISTLHLINFCNHKQVKQLLFAIKHSHVKFAFVYKTYPILDVSFNWLTKHDLIKSFEDYKIQLKEEGWIKEGF